MWAGAFRVQGAIKFGGKYPSRMPQVPSSGAEATEIYSWPPQIAPDASRRSLPGRR